MSGGVPLFVCSQLGCRSLLAGKLAAHVLFASSEEPQTLEGSVWGKCMTEEGEPLSCITDNRNLIGIF